MAKRSADACQKARKVAARFDAEFELALTYKYEETLLLLLLLLCRIYWVSRSTNSGAQQQHPHESRPFHASRLTAVYTSLKAAVF